MDRTVSFGESGVTRTGTRRSGSLRAAGTPAASPALEQKKSRSRSGGHMKGQMETRASRLRASLVVLLAVAAVVAAVPAFAEPDNSYTVHPLVSNVSGAAVHLDPNLVNAWGLTAGPTSPWWVADNGTH